jgi:hypothetical protein
MSNLYHGLQIKYVGNPFPFVLSRKHSSPGRRISLNSDWKGN